MIIMIIIMRFYHHIMKQSQKENPFVKLKISRREEGREREEDEGIGGKGIRERKRHLKKMK